MKAMMSRPKGDAADLPSHCAGLPRTGPPAIETVHPRWDDFCVVAATGPSLTEEVADACRGYPVLAVKDAARLRMPWAEVMYCCDTWWWERFDGLRSFAGERWSSHEKRANEKLEIAAKYGVRLVRGSYGTSFSTDPALIHYGSNSGYQAVNLAIHLLRGPRKRIALVGFDMRTCERRHFFGPHKDRHNGVKYERFIPSFEQAAKGLPREIEIINCTPGSAMGPQIVPHMPLADVLAGEKSGCEDRH